MIKIIIMTHGDLGKELIRTSESIIGRQENFIILGLSQEDSLAAMCQRVKDVLEINSKDGALVLTDMLGGTPCNACLPFSRDYKVEIITGVNLYMVISSFVNRASMSLEELSKKVMADGKKNIANAKELFVKKME